MSKFGKGRLTINHHLVELGGKIYSDKVIYGAIQGVYKNGTSIITPDIEKLFSVLAKDEAVPTMKDIINVASIQDVDDYYINSEEKYSPRSFIPIPPFMLETIDTAINVTKGDSKEVLIDVIDNIKEFDSEVESLGEWKMPNQHAMI